VKDNLEIFHQAIESNDHKPDVREPLHRKPRPTSPPPPIDNKKGTLGNIGPDKPLDSGPKAKYKVFVNNIHPSEKAWYDLGNVFAKYGKVLDQ
jgi:hypothetical protein